MAHLTLATLLFACIWDRDTMEMERSQFPDVQHVLAGHFARHSPEYYEWRIEDRLARLKKSPKNTALMDDLAAAYDKTGEHGKAIELMRASLAQNPERYETLANLGTFLIHDGELAEGAVFIRKAIKINPDAHFGREIIQLHVVEYVLECRKARKGLPMARDFASFLAERGLKGEKGREAAVKGLVGMMFFGHYDSPILAECLGEVLSRELEVRKGKRGYAIRHTTSTPRRLAARAFLRASYGTEEPKARAYYRQRALGVLQMQTRGKNSYKQMTLEELEKNFRRDCRKGVAYVADIRANELRWIAEDVDVDKKFHAKYFTRAKQPAE